MLLLQCKMRIAHGAKAPTSLLAVPAPSHTHLPSHAPRVISSIKDQVVCVSLGAAFTAAICNQTEALAGRFSVPVLYTSAVKRRECRAQLARVMAARAMVAKDRWGVTCDV